jgi:predicted transcriptional regulator
MKDDSQCIPQLLAATRNGNMPETKLCLQYGRHFPRSSFDDALGKLIDAGMVERVQPLHVRLK